MSDIRDNPSGGRWRVVPLRSGTFRVEEWGEWDSRADWPYWAQCDEYSTREAAEGYIRGQIVSVKERLREVDESLRLDAEFAAKNPPYVFWG